MNGFHVVGREALLDIVIDLMRQAGNVVLSICQQEFSVNKKGERSHMTQADCLSEILMVPALSALLPRVPVVTEESVEANGAPEIKGCFWLVNPLVGPRSFINRNGEFTVNVAKIEKGVPVQGGILALAIEGLFAGVEGVGVHAVLR